MLYLEVAADVIVITAFPVKFFAIVTFPLLSTFTDLLFDEYVSFALYFTEALIFTVCVFLDVSFIIFDALIVLFAFTITNLTAEVPV